MLKILTTHTDNPFPFTDGSQAFGQLMNTARVQVALLLSFPSKREDIGSRRSVLMPFRLYQIDFAI